MALAYRAGAPLKDMEFVQYHPTGLPFTGILITEATRAEGGWLLNKDGYRYLQDYDLGKPEPTPVLRSMELGPRDRLSQAFVHEVEKGRTIESPYGPIVHLDLRHLGEKLIDTKLPMVRELCLKYERIDPVKELIPVRPVVHYMMGGVSTDINGATPIEGLFAAGETACVSINGANRLGSNSLPECLVFGARAGRAAAEYAATAKPPPDCRAAARPKTRYGGSTSCCPPTAEPSGSPTSAKTMQSTMEDSAGIYRSGDSLAKGIDQLAESQQRLEHVGLDRPDPGRSTPSWSPRWSWRTCSISPKPSCSRRIQREESRGAHQRTDFTGARRHALPRPRAGLPRSGRIRPGSSARR